jgi:hypothetical protein
VRSVTAGEPALSVPDDDGSSQGGGDHRRPAAHVERFGSAGQHDPPDRTVAGDPPGQRRVDRARVIQFAEAAGAIGGIATGRLASGQGLGAHGHRNVGALPGHRRPVTEVQPLPAHLAEGIRSSLGRRPAVISTLRS